MHIFYHENFSIYSIQWLLCLMYTEVVEATKVLHVTASQFSRYKPEIGYLCMQQIAQ